jgi:hypothetical protein
MLMRVFSSWGKLFGLGTAFPKVEEERRAWGRIPCNVETTCAAAKSGPSRRVPARVRNVSRTGINLELPIAYEPGEMLSVLLPGGDADEACELLACVTRCESAAEGAHKTACTFATHLTNDEMSRFGGLKSQESDSDQRVWARFPCPAQAVFKVVGEEETAHSQGLVLNISASGIAMQVLTPRMVGELLSIELWRGEDRQVVNTLASIVRTTVERDGQRIVGCNFIHELTEEQVRRLL